ncbi:MAG: EscU/YscU/HrcU family type III secretion system export apparatus switch protein [Actinomycetota bacterium]
MSSQPKKDEKTEAPTPKKKRESRQKGQIARSQDATAWASVLIGIYIVPLTVGRMARVFDDSLNRLAQMPATALDADTMASLFGSTLLAGFLAIAPLAAVAWASSFMASFAQTGPMLSLKPLKPDFKKISPKSGFKRIFSGRSLWETAKQLIKIAVIIGAAWPGAQELMEQLVGASRPAFGAGLQLAGAATVAMVRNVAWAMLIVSLADYGYQKYRHGQDLKMTKQEVKDENKNTEGDQLVKGRIRSAQRDMARNRMIANVADANVIITNPTHIAVALQYDPMAGGAPSVVATGAGAVAAKIRAAGAEHGVPMVEAKPLARALWRACDVGDAVPIALYEAVAKVLVFVQRIDRRKVRPTPVDLPPSSQVEAELLESIPAKKGRRPR